MFISKSPNNDVLKNKFIDWEFETTMYKYVLGIQNLSPKGAVASGSF